MRRPTYKTVAYSELNPKSAAGAVTADVDEENDLQNSNDVPAKSVADGETKSESAADAFTADVDVDENDLQSLEDVPAKSVANSECNHE